MANFSRELLPIVARAMTLEERLQASRSAPAEVLPDSVERIAPWVRTAAGGDRELFRRRLSWDGLEEAAVAATLEAVLPISQESAPSWTSVLFEALGGASRVAEEFARGAMPEQEWLAESEPPRFPEVWIPFLRVARNRLAASAVGRLDLLGEPARRALEASLLAQMAWMAELTLYDRFSAERNARVTSEGVGTSDGGQRPLYTEFIESLLLGGLVRLLEEFSVLARLVCILVEAWVETTAELLERLAADRESLNERFEATGRVVELQPGLSDRHAGGRAALLLVFESGAKLVYKPRTLALEAAWNEFLGWLSEQKAEPHLPRARVLERPGYGYVEFLRPGVLSNAVEAREYFRCAGGLIAVAWLLGINDLHLDNVIATAAGPVVIDSESALQPEISPPRNPAATENGAASWLGAWISDSVLRSGLVTTPQLDGAGRPADIGGLRGTGGYPLSSQRRAFRNPNTDQMELVWEAAFAPEMQNLPARDGRRLLPDEFPGAICEGFSSMYRFLLDHREEMAHGSGPLARFAGTRTRLVIRPSDVYARLLAELSAPGHLREGTMRSFAIESLSLVFAGEVARPRLWPLVREERRALERFDIPYFTLEVDSRELKAEGGEVIRGFVARSGLEAVRQRLTRMSEDHLEQERAALAAHLGVQEGRVKSEPTRGLTEPWCFWIRLAIEIGEELLRTARRDEGGSLHWNAPAFSKFEEGSLASLCLYEGALGPALFLAALARRTENDKFRQAARGACRTIATALAAPEPSTSVALGAGEGIGSLVYGLGLTGRILDDSQLLALAARAASLLTPERIRADEALDVQTGSAGAILGLLALAEVSPSAGFLESAILCGEHLLSRRRNLGERRCGWPSPQGRCLAGCAHGAAGIALALLRLAAATGRAEFREVAEEGLRYERGLFDPGEGNWAILGRDGRRLFMLAWCHGAPGILLARLATGSGLDAAEWQKDIERAIAATRQAPILTTDHLCCGNAAIIEALLEAGHELSRTDLLAEARARAMAVIHRAGARGSFRFRMSETEDASFQPAFFRGLSGLGYTMLRLDDPASLPSVLRFAPAPTHDSP